MNDRESIDLLRRALALYAAGTATSRTPECLDDGVIAALADGSLDVKTRAGALPHLTSCSRCRSAVASVARALADSLVARERRALEGAVWRRLVRIAAPLAAAAVLLLLVWPRHTENGGLPHRAPTITAAAAPVPLSPVGVVVGAKALQWKAVAGAELYRVTLFDAAGGVRYESVLADTVVSVPDSIILTPGQPYLWKVEARTGFDRWSASDLVEFSIAGGTPR
jgi:hypothetical protein